MCNLDKELWTLNSFEQMAAHVDDHDLTIVICNHIDSRYWAGFDSCIPAHMSLHCIACIP